MINIMGENLKLPVEILHLISPQKISVRVSHENVLPKYYQLQADIQQFCFYEQKEILKTLDPTEGSCLVKHERFYHRGRVLQSSDAKKVRVRLVDIGKEELFHPLEVFELPHVFAQVSAFSFTVCLSVTPGQQFLDSEKSLEVLSGLLQNAPNIYMKKIGEVEHHQEHNTISVEISWTETVCDGPMSPLNTKEVFLSDELVKAGILISGGSNNNVEEDKEEAEATLPPNRLTVELGTVVDCCVQALVHWNLLVVHLNTSATRQALAQICQCMENFAATFPRVEKLRPGMLVSYHQQRLGWVRGKILVETSGCRGRTQLLVSLLDYGTKERVHHLDNFRILPQRLRQFPSLAVSVKLPLDKSNPGDSVLFSQMEETILQHKECTRVRILRCLPSADQNTLLVQGHLLDKNNSLLYDTQ